MRINEIKSRWRRDFWGVFGCEHCGYEAVKRGYDDYYYHHVVLPKMICPECERATVEVEPIGIEG